MGNNERIGVESATHFELKKEELKRLYLTMAMIHFPPLCVPDYSERILLEKLLWLFKKPVVEFNQKMADDCNNLQIHRMRNYFELHYKNIKELLNND